MEMEHFVEGLLDESREEVNRADSKANILLAAIGVSGAAIGGAFLTGNATLSGAPAVVQARPPAATPRSSAPPICRP